MGTIVRARAPGRVNLIGGHVDYTGGLVCPIAIDRETVVQGARGGDRVVLRSDQLAGEAVVPLDVADPASVEPAWARYVAGVVAELRPHEGFTGSVSSSVPVGVGLSSSAALEVSVALALGHSGTATDLARLCQRAEHRSSGVPCGIMDQLASASGVDGHALLIDCTTLTVTPVALPPDLALFVVDSGQPRTLAGSAYAERRSQCEAAAAQIGPLRQATVDDVARITDPTVRRRARHVVTENERVVAFVDALRAGDLATVGRLVDASHASLRDDMEVSTNVLDRLAQRLRSTPGVLGVRLTGGGFGGSLLVLARTSTEVEGWAVRANRGAYVEMS